MTPHQTNLTKHADRRMVQRGIRPEAVDLVLVYGRAVHTRGAVVHAIGRKEVMKYRRKDIDLSGCEGVQVVCSTEGSVLTVYRNHDFRGLRCGLGRGRHRPAGIDRDRSLVAV